MLLSIEFMLRLRKNGQPVHRLKLALSIFEVASNGIRLVYCAGPGLGELQTAGSPAKFTITAHDADGVRATSGTTYMCNTIAITESVRFQVHSRALNIIDV